MSKITENIDSDFFKLEVKESRITDAGEGVFATRKIVKGEIICEYRGTIVEYNEDKDKKESHNLTYTDMSCDDDHFIRGNSVASKVNDLISFSKYTDIDINMLVIVGKLKRTVFDGKELEYNCFYKGAGSKVFIVASADIEVGQELYVEYGLRYWFRRLFDEGFINFQPAEK